jgi:putative intracellular protease/amidase
MKIRLTILVIILTGAAIFIGSAPIREFRKIPVYKGQNKWDYSATYDPSKKNVFIIADNKGTEIFDLLAPFHLFHRTNRVNVFVIAKNKFPIVLMKGVYILPHYTYEEIDALAIVPDVVVVPNLAGSGKKDQDPELVNWIKNRYNGETKLLSVCAGSFTTAATGLYDGKVMTTHASDMKSCKSQYQGPVWVDQVTFTRSGNLYSTAGVSNAVEGTLAVIRDLFGHEMMMKVMREVRYPFAALKHTHNSQVIQSTNKLDIIKKVLFQHDPEIGVLLQEGINELSLAAVLDSYHRSFPASIKTYANNKAITSQYGLTMIPTGNMEDLKNFDELHILSPENLSDAEKSLVNKNKIVSYDSSGSKYIIEICLERIARLYGHSFEMAVRRLLDYN